MIIQSPPLRATSQIAICDVAGEQGGASLIAICDVAGRQGKRYRFGGRDFVWGGFEGCWGKGAHFRAGLGVGSFIPAFARCCFCIAASLLVFTSPMTSPLAQFFQWTKAKDLMSSLHICTHRRHPQTTMATAHLNFRQHRLIRQCHQHQFCPAQ